MDATEQRRIEWTTENPEESFAGCVDNSESC